LIRDWFSGLIGGMIGGMGKQAAKAESAASDGCESSF
jgi:hypothetical protein